MEVLIRVICIGSGSLREKIVNDSKLQKFNLEVSKYKIPGRNPGWAKLHSTENYGAVNVHWNGQTKTLVCRVVTKRTNKPDNIIGDFLGFLMARHRKRIKAIIL